MKGLVLLVLLPAVASAIPFPEDVSQQHQLIRQSIYDFLSDPGALVELERGADWPGCGLGHFWCATLRDAGMTSGNASKLTILPSHDNTYSEVTLVIMSFFHNRHGKTVVFRW